MVERSNNYSANMSQAPKQCTLCNALPDEQHLEKDFTYLEVMRGTHMMHQGWFCSMPHMAEKRAQWKEEDKKFLEEWRQDVSD